MRVIRTTILLWTFFLPGEILGQPQFVGKVYESGSKTYFDNVRKCDFYFECDCCSGKIVFYSASDYYLINYCMSDFTITKGQYSISGDSLVLKSDGIRIDKQYNWELEVNPEASPEYIIKDSTVVPYRLKYIIDKCDKTMLVNNQNHGIFIAIETNLDIDLEFVELKKYGLLGRIVIK